MFGRTKTMSIDEFLYGTQPPKFELPQIPEIPFNPIDDFINKNMNSDTNGISKIMQELMDTLTKLPTLSDIPGVLDIFNVMRGISFGCISLVVLYIGYNNLISCHDDNITKKIEEKQLFSRIFYAIAMSQFSLKFIDVLILLNNTLIKIIISHFKMGVMSVSMLSGSFGLLITLAVFFAQVYFSIKVFVGYWIRLAELLFTGIISPAIFTLSINPKWANTSSWFRRVASLIFTQFAQVILLVISSMMANGLAISGTLKGACLSIASLFLMCNTPRIISSFIENTDSSLRKASYTINKAKHRILNPINKFRR